MNRWKIKRKIYFNEGNMEKVARQEEVAMVLVLLSTYNAQDYLREQLDSLLEQSLKQIKIVIRDDGSSDDTIGILEEYSDIYPNITYYQGENLGAADSFFDLMKHVRKEAFSYVAFCDQDDFWLEDKLKHAVKTIDQLTQYSKKGPVLYCGKPQLVDQDLNILEQEINREIRPGFSNALIENIVTGCTMVLNRSLFDLLVAHLPEYCIMHDWWCYLMASCYGLVVYDEQPYLYYRQHQNNVMGIDGSYVTEFSHRVKKYKSRQGNIVKQAKELLVQMSQISVENPWSEDVKKLPALPEMLYLSHPVSVSNCRKRAMLLAHYKEGKTRLSLSFGKVVYRQRKVDDAIYRLLFLLGIR